MLRWVCSHCDIYWLTYWWRGGNVSRCPVHLGYWWVKCGVLCSSTGRNICRWRWRWTRYHTWQGDRRRTCGGIRGNKRFHHFTADCCPKFTKTELNYFCKSVICCIYLFSHFSETYEHLLRNKKKKCVRKCKKTKSAVFYIAEYLQLQDSYF